MVANSTLGLLLFFFFLLVSVVRIRKHPHCEFPRLLNSTFKHYFFLEENMTGSINVFFKHVSLFFFYFLSPRPLSGNERMSFRWTRKRSACCPIPTWPLAQKRAMQSARSSQTGRRGAAEQNELAKGMEAVSSASPVTYCLPDCTRVTFSVRCYRVVSS